MRGVAIDCDEAGRFRSSAFLDEGYALFARLTDRESKPLEDGTPVAPLALVHADRMRSQDLVCDLDELALVRIRVVDHRARPVRGASVVLANGGATDSGGPRFTCDRRGRLAVRVARHGLLAIAACSADATGTAYRRIHGACAIEVKLRAPIVLEGRLLDDDGLPVPGVRFRRDDFNLQTLLFGNRLLDLLPQPTGHTTDARGKFKIRLPGPIDNLRIRAISDQRLDQAKIDRAFGQLELATVRESQRDLEWRLSDF